MVVDLEGCRGGAPACDCNAVLPSRTIWTASHLQWLTIDFLKKQAIVETNIDPVPSIGDAALWKCSWCNRAPQIEYSCVMQWSRVSDRSSDTDLLGRSHAADRA
jgi:hypothetical protein